MTCWPRRNRRLTPELVYEIRQFVDEGWTAIWGNCAAIALAYGVCKGSIWNIGSRYDWFGLPERTAIDLGDANAAGLAEALG